MFSGNFDPTESAVVENISSKKYQAQGVVSISYYSPNKVTIKTSTDADSFLVLTDSYYRTWNAKIDGKNAKVYITDFDFRGVELPKGNHIVEFEDHIL